MARPLRIELANGVYHVTSRGLERGRIVKNDQDRARWVDLLGEVTRRRGWRVLAWALMDNHYHLFLRTPRADLSAGLHDLNAGYVTGFNRRHRRVGPLLQGRFKAILVERDYHYWELSRYVHLNPVRAGLAGRPEAYPWSSCRWFFASGDVPDWLAWEEVLSGHGRTLRAARGAYRQFLREGMASLPRSPLEEALASALLGSAKFIERTKAWLQDRLPDREVPTARALRDEVTLTDVIGAVKDVCGVKEEALAVRGRHHNDARWAAVYVSRKLTRSPIETIAARFGGIRGSAVSHMVARSEVRRSRDRAFDALIRRVEAAVAEKSSFRTCPQMLTPDLR